MLITLNSFQMSTDEDEEESGIAPHFSQPLKTRKINPKLPLTLECVVVGTPAPVIKWFARKQEITSLRGKKITYSAESGIATLKILKPTPEDFCSYCVQAVNSFVSAECRIDLSIGKGSKVHKPIVLEAPKITQPLEAKIVCYGESITLECQFEGTPLPSVKWYFKGKEISNTDVKITTTECKSCLQISEAYRQNSGKYEIQVLNCKGEARSSGTVSVTDPEPDMEEVIPPRFVKPLEAFAVAIGDVVILETFVQSYPTCSFQWFQHSLPITLSSELNVCPTTANHSVLLIDKALTHHTGAYTCRAENVGGSVQQQNQPQPPAQSQEQQNQSQPPAQSQEQQQQQNQPQPPAQSQEQQQQQQNQQQPAQQRRPTGFFSSFFQIPSRIFSNFLG